MNGQIEELNRNLEVVKEKEPQSSMKGKTSSWPRNKDEGIFKYREKRRQQWKIEKTSTMLAEREWNEQCGQERLVKLQKVQKDFEDLLDSTTNHNSGNGPTEQGRR